MKGATSMSLQEIIPNKNSLIVSPLLINLGIPLSLSGHRYLCSAVNIYSSLMQTNSRITINEAKGKPTNGEFIATISYWLTSEAASAVVSM